MREVYKIGKLDDWITISKLGIFGRISCKDYDTNNMSRDLYHYNLKNIKWFRKRFQKKLKSNYKNYDRLKLELESIRTWTEKEIKTEKGQLLEMIDNELKKFRKTEKFNRENDNLEWGE